MKLTCIIIDDEPVARKILKEFADDVNFLEVVACVENPLKALPFLNTQTIDVIFLDINMPKINGIDFLAGLTTRASVIMTTAYAQHAAEAYNLDVLDYLVKPIAFNRFLKACDKALKAHELKQATPVPDKKSDDHFFIKCDNQIEKIVYSDLLYAEAMLNYVMLHTHTKKMMVYITIKSLEEQLPPEIFMKVHKSFLVNILKVQSIEGNMLNIGNAKITISQNLREAVIRNIVKDKMIRR